ncbi:MAG: hypothetical protein HYS25_10025 [Ignavibacteriales bacterium]|nr:hypothetical protein [Ignavibacteriales bacterium]
MAWQQMRTRVIIGILLIIVGALFLLRNFHIFYLPHYLITWEYFFILFGFLLFALSRNKTAGIIFIAIGLFNIVPQLSPLIFVLIGLYIIFRRRDPRCYYKRHEFAERFHNTNFTETKSKDFIDDVAVFGGSSKVYDSDNFKGGSVVSIFGGSEINLLNCKLAPGKNTIDITAIFGGSTIIVPSNWKIEIDLVPIFGGFGDKRRKDPNAVVDENSVLIIKGLVFFGGGEIKN